MKLVRIHSHEGAATLHPRRYGAYTAAMIRMSTMPEFVPLVFRDAYLDVLELRFADVTDSGWKYMQENEQDLINEMLAQGHSLWPMTENHAQQIVDFVHRLADQIDLLVVHCDAGVARSSAVALEVCYKYDLGDQSRLILDNPRYRPNLTVRKLVRECFTPELKDEERQRLYEKLFIGDTQGS